MLGFCFFGFGSNGIWNLEEDLRLSFVSLVLFRLESLGPKGEC